MAKIHKLTKGGQTIYPATTTDAVVHPTTRKNLTEELFDLKKENGSLSFFKQNTPSQAGNIDLRCINLSLKSGSYLKFRVDLLKGEATNTYEMLSYYGKTYFDKTQFNIGEEYILPLIKDFDTDTELVFGAYIKNNKPGAEAKFTAIVNYQLNASFPVITDKIADGAITTDKIADNSIDTYKKIINPLFLSIPYWGNVIKDVYIDSEDIPIDAKNPEKPLFTLEQILYAYGEKGWNRIRIAYLKNDGTYANPFGDTIQTEDKQGSNAAIKFGLSGKSYAIVNFSELSYLGYPLNSEIVYNPTGDYKFITERIVHRQFHPEVIPPRSISSDMLVDDLLGSGNPYSGFELYTIGDSLFAGGVWQNEVAKRLEIKFDQNKNADPSFPLSIGGTSSDMSRIGTTYFRTLNLIKKGYIQDKGEKSVIILENVNDGIFDFDVAAPSFKMDKSYSVNELSTSNLNDIPKNERSLNAVVGLKKISNGKKLIINTLPTKEGDVRIRTGWAGPGESDYNIHVIPQGNDELTKLYVIDRIVEYSYKGIFDTAGSDGNSVYFTNGNNDYETTLKFTDTGGTGMSCSIETVSDAPWEIYYWYIGSDIEDVNWGDVKKWIIPSVSSAWKSSIEELLRNFPKAHIFIVNFPAISKTANDYYNAEKGIYDESRWYTDTQEKKSKALKQFSNISGLYNIPLIDIWGNMNMSASNWNEFFPSSANIHPLESGYERIGCLLASMIKKYI